MDPETLKTDVKNFRNELEVFSELSRENVNEYSKELAAIHAHFRTLDPKGPQYKAELGRLSVQLKKLRQKWEDSVVKAAPADIYDKDTLGQNLTEYKQVWDSWQKNRDDRLDYNKYFLTLLFVSTLVAILTPLLSTTGIVALTPFAIPLYTAVLAGAIVISLVWALKLWVLQVIDRTGQKTLRAMESEMRIPFSAMSRWSELQDELAPSQTWRCKGWWVLGINYWALPVLMFVLFAGLFFYTLVFHPSFTPLYNGTLNNTTIVNATIANSTIRNSTILNSTIVNATSAPP
jgi:hypothetical protein